MPRGQGRRYINMKMPTPIFEGDIVKNKLKLSEREKESIKRWCATFKNGTHLDITIRKHKSKRTNDQNAYYWKIVVGILADEFGYEPDEMHMVLREKFLRIYDDKHPDFVIAKSTTKLNTVEFVEYVETIQRWASIDHHIYIPDPKKIT